MRKCHLIKFVNVKVEKCYQKVISGNEAKRAIKSNSNPNYRNELNKELDEINNQKKGLCHGMYVEIRTIFL